MKIAYLGWLCLLIPLLNLCHNTTGKNSTGPEGKIQTQSVQVNPDLVDGNNRFAVELYREIRSAEKNTFFSPFSISAAMAMTYAGARGESEKQISQVMHFDGDQQKFHPEYAALLSYIRQLEKEGAVEISTANNLFAQKDYPFSEAFFKQVTDHYGAGVKNVDFRNEREKSRQEINQWVEQQTRDRIRELLAPGMLTELTRLVLVNAVYFYGAWQEPFDSTQTRVFDFYTDSVNTVEAAFMNREDTLRYLALEDFKMVEIPYAGKNLSMVILLPSRHSNMEKLEKSLTADQLKKWMNQMSPTKIHLTLPKFKMTCDFELSEALKKMGMPHPFSLAADLSGMTGKKDLMIDKVVHKAFIDVTEKGTEAAGATAVIVRVKNGASIPEFRATRPFIFLIKENQYQGILFMGRVNHPSSDPVH